MRRKYKSRPHELFIRRWSIDSVQIDRHAKATVRRFIGQIDKSAETKLVDHSDDAVWGLIVTIVVKVYQNEEVSRVKRVAALIVNLAISIHDAGKNIFWVFCVIRNLIHTILRR